jgi:hypothetical protein
MSHAFWPPQQQLVQNQAYSIMCWNVRNLSDTMTRQGVRGRGVGLARRVKSIALTIKKYAPSITILLETGVDGDYVSDIIENNVPGYKAFVSGDSGGGETYVVVYNPYLIQIKVNQLIGNVDGYRKAILLGIKIDAIEFVLVSLHAPSPGHDISIRLQVIQDAIKTASALYPKSSIIFCGDLNIKLTEYENFKKAMPANFIHAGPFDADGKNPASTSLRKYFNALLGNHESQPYDQFWTFNCQASKCELITPEVTIDPQKKFIQLITSDLNDNCDITKVAFKPTRSSTTILNIDKTYVIQDLITTFILVKSEIDSYSAQVISLLESTNPDIKKWKDSINTLNASLTKQDWYIALTNTGAAQITQQNYNQWKYLLDEFNSSLLVAYNYLDKATGGKKGDSMLLNAVYEYAISDHFPVRTTFLLK